MKARHGLKKVSIPNLSPPPVPRNREDWEGRYTIQCRTYAGYQHFRERAAFYREKVRGSREKKENLTANYCARLCENISRCLARMFKLQTSKSLRDWLRKARKHKHAIDFSNPKLKASQKRYASLMLQAMHHLPDDPFVLIFRRTREALGERDYLRKARKALEKDIQRPYSSPIRALADQTILELADDGLSPGKIRAKLKAEGLPAPSREWIRKRIKQSVKQRASIVRQHPIN